MQNSSDGSVLGGLYKSTWTLSQHLSHLVQVHESFFLILGPDELVAFFRVHTVLQHVRALRRVGGRGLVASLNHEIGSTTWCVLFTLLARTLLRQKLVLQLPFQIAPRSRRGVLDSALPYGVVHLVARLLEEPLDGGRPRVRVQADVSDLGEVRAQAAVSPRTLLAHQHPTVDHAPVRRRLPAVRALVVALRARQGLRHRLPAALILQRRVSVPGVGGEELGNHSLQSLHPLSAVLVRFSLQRELVRGGDDSEAERQVRGHPGVGVQLHRAHDELHPAPAPVAVARLFGARLGRGFDHRPISLGALSVPGPAHQEPPG
mmetsp:Transcript_30703/g.59227  ORF Transcript_30703/g.59227 Transcript_30703/m.59227 type:complete len:318 (-) Transcript_30703:366-1319(-)